MNQSNPEWIIIAINMAMLTTKVRAPQTASPGATDLLPGIKAFLTTER